MMPEAPSHGDEKLLSPASALHPAVEMVGEARLMGRVERASLAGR